MRTEHLVIGGGFLLVLVVLVLALGGEPGGNRERRMEEENTTAQTGFPSPPTLIPTAMPGLVPFTPSDPKPFRGVITTMATLGDDGAWGQVHIWIRSDSGLVREISLAPSWFLVAKGCGVTPETPVSGSAFSFDPSRPDGELYARSIEVNGRRCLLRTDEGLALYY